MEDRLFSSDLILIFSNYLSTRDIFNIGGTSRKARLMIRKNATLWKKIVCRRCPCELWTKVSLEDDDYVNIAIKQEAKLAKALRKYHIFYRLAQPMSSKDALRVFLEITTPNLPAPHDKVIIPGVLHVEGTAKKQKYTFVFRRNDGKPFHIWDEGPTYTSEDRFYTIDRCNREPLDVTLSASKFRECFQIGMWISKAKTILSKDDYAFINGVLKLDIPKEDRGKIVKSRDAPVNINPNNRAPPNNDIQRQNNDARLNNILIGNFPGWVPKAVDPHVYAYTSWTIQVDFNMWFRHLYFANPNFDHRTGVGLSISGDTLSSE